MTTMLLVLCIFVSSFTEIYSPRKHSAAKGESISNPEMMEKTNISESSSGLPLKKPKEGRKSKKLSTDDNEKDLIIKTAKRVLKDVKNPAYFKELNLLRMQDDEHMCVALIKKLNRPDERSKKYLNMITDLQNILNRAIRMKKDADMSEILRRERDNYRPLRLRPTYHDGTIEKYKSRKPYLDDGRNRDDDRFLYQAPLRPSLAALHLKPTPVDAPKYSLESHQREFDRLTESFLATPELKDLSEFKKELIKISKRDKTGFLKKHGMNQVDRIYYEIYKKIKHHGKDDSNILLFDKSICEGLSLFYQRICEAKILLANKLSETDIESILRGFS